MDTMSGGKEDVLRTKSFAFAVQIISLCRHLTEDRREYILSKQLLRSGTSVGANVREAANAESKADFIHKLSVALKEIDETMYWLELLKETVLIGEEQFGPVHGQAEEIIRILKRSLITAKSRL